jgi:hypothetical protein
MILALFFSLAFAAEVVSAPKAAVTSTSLPHCVDDAKEIEAIKARMKANKSNSSKYEGYRAALQSDSDSELTARLIYAETLAANCPAQNGDISRLISQVIANRVTKRGGNVRSVVFERDQFASSLNIYDESRFADFLCPTDEKLWKTITSPPSEKAPTLSPSTVHYFLYKHSPRWTKEPWKFTEEVAELKHDVRNCLRVFKNEKWK